MTHHVPKFNLGNLGLNNGPQTPEEMRRKRKSANRYTSVNKEITKDYNGIIKEIDDIQFYQNHQ